MKKRNLMLILGVISVVSCTVDNEMIVESVQVNVSESYEIVLKERDPKYPLEFPERKKSRNSVVPLATLKHEDYLGYSYKLDYFPLGTAMNLANPIIDLAKLRENEPFYIVSKELGIQEASSFSYADFDRYLYKSKDTKKIRSGFGINLKAFSLGNKSTMTEIYTSSIANETNRVFGQMNVEVLGVAHTLQTTSNAMKKIKLNYLNPTFREEIYSITMGEFIDTYGALVLTSFITGGRVTAMYSGIHKSTSSVDVKERSMDIDISATYGDKKEGDKKDNNISFGFGRDYYRETETSQKITNLTTSVKAIGGNLSFPVFGAPQSVSQINIDLSKWQISLTPDSYRMIDIHEGGLLPLSDFVLEENIEEHVVNYLYTGESSPIKRVQEPYIEIMHCEIVSSQLLLTTLVTKNGDKVLIDAKGLTDVPVEIRDQYIQEVVDKKSEVYGLKIVQKYLLNPGLGGGMLPFYYFQFYDENLFEKFIDEENNTMYLLYKNDNAEEDDMMETDENGCMTLLPGFGRFGLSLYNYKRTLNLYGLTDFVEKLPTANGVDREDLLTYRIVSL